MIAAVAILAGASGYLAARTRPLARLRSWTEQKALWTSRPRLGAVTAYTLTHPVRAVREQLALTTRATS